jgi:ribosomal protein L29
MKRIEHLTHLRKLSLPDMKQEIVTLERKLQEEKMSIAFGNSKQVRNIRALKRQLARGLTVAHMALQTNNAQALAKEKSDE